MKKHVYTLLIAFFLLSLSPPSVMGAPVITDVTDIDGTTITGGVYGDIVRVFGEGVTAGVEMNLYWDALKSWDGEKGFLNSSEAYPNGSFEIWFEVPEGINGPHYLWFKDTGDDSSFGPESFTVDAMIRLTPSSGLSGDKITIKGYGFGDEENVDTIEFDTEDLNTNPSIPVTDELGSWEATFNVPSKADNDYTITAEDADANTASETFAIGPAIVLDIEEGPVGTIVEVGGRGFTPGDSVISITLGGVDCGVTDEDDRDIDNDGDFTFEFAVPSVNKGGKEYELVVSDDGGKDAKTYFTVTGLTGIVLDPMFGPPGTSVSIEGSNFAPSKQVTISVGTTDVKTLQTNSNGEFSGSFGIPAIASGTYDVTAEQDHYNIEDSRSLRVGTMVAILTPTTGPTGTEVALMGTGFTAGGEWNASMNGKTLFEDQSVGGDTTLFGTFYVPTLEPGEYTVTITDVDEEIRVTKEFTVTDKTSITMEPIAAPVGYNVTIEGSYFTESDNEIEVEFTIYNSTDDWEMEVYSGSEAVTTGEEGKFTAWWVVPEDLSQGAYTVNATDDEGLFSQSGLSIGSSIVSITPYKAPYNREDTVKFTIESSFREEGSYIKILDPDGGFVWETDDLDTWKRDEATYVSPFYTQTAGGNPLTLEDDAPFGSWSFTWYDSDDEELASGSFLVEEESAPDDEEPGDGEITDTQYEELQGEIEDLKDEVDQLEDEVDQLLTTIEQLTSTTTGSIDDVVTEVEDVKEDAVDALNSAKEAKDLATEAKDGIDEAKNDAERALSTAKSHSTMIFAALGASLLAILMVFIGPLQITRRSPV
jgi:5-hydroxyisourate hydrolase-like protein (transthyretin family)